ncbi:MAG: hypothetical protein GY754_15035 [bacterium]|nr:hypothetical protein [bacterium]
MKNTILILFLSSAICFFFSAAQGKTNNRAAQLKIVEKKIEDINSTPLIILSNKFSQKKFRDAGPKKDKIFRYYQNKRLEFTNSWVFYDRHNRIRKYITQYDEQDMARDVYYYDEKGSLTLVMFLSANHASCSGEGKIYFLNKKPVKIAAVSDCCGKIRTIQDNFRMRKCTQIPPEEVLSPHYTTKDLVKKLKLSRAPGKKIFYKPRSPKPGDITLINGNKVRIRNKPSTKGTITATSTILYYVKILLKEKEETIAPWGTHNWYKVQYYERHWHDNKKTGCIFGAFLEPVYERMKQS